MSAFVLVDHPAPQFHPLQDRNTHPHTLESWNNLIDLYQAWNKPEKAKEWRSKRSKTEALTE
jgi:hypothetical protein